MNKRKTGSSNHLKLEHLIKHNPIIQMIYRYGMSTVFRVWGAFIKTDNNLVLMNGHGYKYNDSPRAIYEKMLELGMAKKYKIVWALNDPESTIIPGKAKKIKMDTIEYFKTALKAKYWIACVNIERGLQFKKKNQVYLNTWHGASVIYVGNAVGGRNDFHFEHINYFCYNGEYERDFIKRDFNVRDAALLPTGYPRNDALYEATEETKIELRKKIGIPKDKKVILYAPTWRESEDGGNTYKLAPPIDWIKWERELGDNYVVLLRTHPYTTKLMNVKFNDFVRDCINYPQVNDLMIVADIMISDYSCILLDYAILEKPIICFGYDYEEYTARRGEYFNIDKTIPNGVLHTEDQVIKHIKTLDYKDECKKTKELKNRYMEYGGNATLTCINKVFKTHYSK